VGFAFSIHFLDSFAGIVRFVVSCVKLSYFFAATVQKMGGTSQWAPLMASASLFEPLYQQMLDAMLNAIAGDPVPERPDRAEPRARKRRPKNYQLLTKPRREFRECPHRSKYVKA